MVCDVTLIPDRGRNFFRPLYLRSSTQTAVSASYPLTWSPFALFDDHEDYKRRAPPINPKSVAAMRPPGSGMCPIVVPAAPDDDAMAAAEEATVDALGDARTDDVDIDALDDALDDALNDANEVILATPDADCGDCDADPDAVEGSVMVTLGNLIGLLGAEAHCSTYATSQNDMQS